MQKSMNSGNYIILCLTILLVLIFLDEVPAKVSGDCSNCHTMHNSQNGQPMARQLNTSTYTFETDITPNEALLISDCVGCHTSTSSSTWQDATTGAPIVFNTNEPTYGANGLAGGNFYYVSTIDDDKGHNIFTSNTDDIHSNTPPGGAALASQITCAGTVGCHGHNGRQTGDTAVDNEAGAMKGGHHVDDTPPLDGSLTSVARNYRFLLGIKGKEDADWEQDNVNTSHNEYKGSTSSATDTISYLCAECHGNFHTWEGGAAEVGTASPWLRHPTDIELPGTGEYANYTAYSMKAPVARPDPDSGAVTPEAVTPGMDIIMCLSCHRAHASPNFKIIRWDYKSSTLSEAISGCGVCHTSKN